MSGDEEVPWELVRALGVLALTPPPGTAPVSAALGLPTPSGAEHTATFVLSAPPHAGVHLGTEGQLGGEGLDRVAGFRRALGLTAGEDADHLGALLVLLAELGESADGAAAPATRHRMRRTVAALFAEHIGSWAPGYLSVVAATGGPSLRAWARLTAGTLAAVEAGLPAAPDLPLALRVAAPPPEDATVGGLLDGLLAPVRSGIVLTHDDLVAGAGTLGVGLRRGERRYVLRAMLEQEPAGTGAWLAGFAAGWEHRHRQRWAATDPHLPEDPHHPVAAWWAARAAATAGLLGAHLDAVQVGR